MVVCIQNHDQIGNRLGGERLGALVPFEALKLAAGAVLLSPFVPLLFMGEEYGEPAPFQYFVSHGDPELIEAVREGRKREFAAFHREGETPDPQDEATFARCRLDHGLRHRGQHRLLQDFYRELIRLRRAEPVLRHLSKETLEATVFDAEQVLLLRRWLGEEQVAIVLHFGAAPATLSLPLPAGSLALPPRLRGGPLGWAGEHGSDWHEFVRESNRFPLPRTPSCCSRRGEERKTLMERFICLHAHLYQPPRENPWLEEIEYQESAYPYHDWNERIAAECYAPNATSRILDGEGRIEQIVNNYSRISFNFGPTLLSWLEQKEPAVYSAILAADRESRERFSGHGSALAQGYNHLILPLANRRDKETQVIWGIRDFERRFGRAPEGMWLPETAVDLETLDLLAAHGIRFTILAPRQGSAGAPAHRPRVAGRGRGPDRPDDALPDRAPLGEDPRALLLRRADLPGGGVRGPAQQRRGVCQPAPQGFTSSSRRRNQLLHIATDGESYGHHHKHGEMALSYALHHIEVNNLARITNYGEFLEKFPPTHEVRIFENSSWSCVHGIERWRSDCGCNSGGHDWNQGWRAPLREALDRLRDELAPLFEGQAGELLKDPWAARNDYIDLILDRSRESLDRFFAAHALQPLSPEEESRALRLLELQRHALLMYTSCGWFFDELSGIETVQVLQYAGRVVQLAQELFGDDGIEPRFLELLERAKSNLPEHGDGRRCYEKFVKPAMVDLAKVGSHYAISSLFESYEEQTRVFCYQVEREDFRSLAAGKARLVLGRAKITSEITRESSTVSFGVLHLGDHNVSGGIREFRGQEAYEALVAEISGIFKSADLPEIIRATDRHFGIGTYSLKLLFRDEQRKILTHIMEQTLADAEAVYRQLYQQHAALLRFLAEMHYPLPRTLELAAELALNHDVRRALQSEDLDLEHLRNTVAELVEAGVPLVEDGHGLAFRAAVLRLAERLSRRAGGPGAPQEARRRRGVRPDDAVRGRVLENAEHRLRDAPEHLPRFPRACGGG